MTKCQVNYTDNRSSKFRNRIILGRISEGSDRLNLPLSRKVGRVIALILGMPKALVSIFMSGKLGIRTSKCSVLIQLEPAVSGP